MTARRRAMGWIAIAVGTLGVLIAAQTASATHVRPRSAAQSQIALVPAYKQCSAPNRTHAPPLAFGSCSPPVQASDYLTVGTPDANGAGANGTGYLRLTVKATPPGDLLISTNITDVRCKPATSANMCQSANAVDGPDYTGQLQSNATIRISDHDNGSNRNEAATVVDIPFPVNYFCASTSDAGIGSSCTVNTSVRALIPQQDLSGKRTIIEVTQIQVFDGGADGNVATAGNTLFEVHGLFFP
jgi:hypothetical protein